MKITIPLEHPLTYELFTAHVTYQEKKEDNPRHPWKRSFIHVVDSIDFCDEMGGDYTPDKATEDRWIRTIDTALEGV